MLVLQTNKTSEIVANQVSIQRDAINDYNIKSDEFEQTIGELQEIQARGIDVQNAYIEELLQEAQEVVASLYNIFDVVENAEYLDKDTIVFMDNLQEQMSSMRSQDSGRQARASYNENHPIYVTILWWDMEVGYHLSPSLCDQLAAWAVYGVVITEAVKLIMSLTGLGAAIAQAIAWVIGLYGALFELGSRNKGCDWIYLDPIPMVCF